MVVRRVLGRLREAGLLTSEKGHSGGWKLAQPPQKITFADVYLALGESLIAADDHESALSCEVEHSLHRRVSSVMNELEEGLIAKLGETTISEL